VVLGPFLLVSGKAHFPSSKLLLYNSFNVLVYGTASVLFLMNLNPLLFFEKSLSCFPRSRKFSGPQTSNDKLRNPRPFGPDSKTPSSSKTKKDTKETPHTQGKQTSGDVERGCTLGKNTGVKSPPHQERVPCTFCKKIRIGIHPSSSHLPSTNSPILPNLLFQTKAGFYFQTSTTPPTSRDQKSCKPLFKLF